MANRSPDDVKVTPAFHREGFGRQSMSEKRKGHIDPKSLDLYQKLKLSKDRTQFPYGRYFRAMLLCSVCSFMQICKYTWAGLLWTVSCV